MNIQMSRASERVRTALANSGPGAHVQRPRLRAAAAGGAVDLYLYSDIGPFGVTANDFAQALRDVGDVAEINLFVNSPGGDAYDGLAIMNLLRRHPARVNAVVDGLAASAASLVILAADHVTMARGSELMVHRAAALCLGNVQDMRDAGDYLEKLDRSIAGLYAERAGGTVEDWLAVMDAETWYSAEEAVAAGLADAVDVAKDAATAKNRFDLAVFAHAGRENAPAPAAVVAALKTAGGSPDGSITTREEPTMSDTLKAAICERLGIKAELEDGDVVAALEEALAEQAETPEPATAPVVEGTVVVDKAAFAELQAKAERGERAEREAVAARRDGIIAQAKADGRITPATEAGFRAALDRDEDGTAALIAALQPVVNLAERGDAREQVETDPESVRYHNVFPKKES